MRKPLDLGPATNNWDWQVKAACRGMSVDLFFNPDFLRGRPKRAHEANAKAICAACPVIGQCLERAIKVGEPDGVWGGLTPRERDATRDRSLTAVA